MTANADRIAYSIDSLISSQPPERYTGQFVPLADVPDIVWKVPPGDTTPAAYRRPHENPNHFADMDRPDSHHRTLLDLCTQQPRNIAVAVWQHYYDDVHDQSRGLLPFRVWQIYRAMVAAVAAGDVARYVCSAGVLAHYVGDACQPLHISYLFNGDPDHTVPTQVRHRDGSVEEQQVPLGTGVHSAYESGMVNRYTGDLLRSVQAALPGATPARPISGGHAAATATVRLMRQTFSTIKPRDLVEGYASVARRANDESQAVLEALWTQFGTATVQVMMLGCQELAMLWESAWHEGKGETTIDATLLGLLAADVLERLYLDPDFLPSYTLDTLPTSALQ